MRSARASGAVPGLAHGVLGLPLALLLVLVDGWIPAAAVAGVVIAYAVPLLDPRPLLVTWRASRTQAGVALFTVAVVLFAGLLSGLQWGLVVSLLVMLVRVARSRASVHQGTDGKPHRVTLSGPITFLAVPWLETMRTELQRMDAAQGVVLDLRNVAAVDLTGCRALLSILAEWDARQGKAALLGAAPLVRSMLMASDRHGTAAARFAVTDAEAETILGSTRAFELRAHVIANQERFREETLEHYLPLFEKLAVEQKPHTLFIGSVDSRLTPSLLTGTHPGDLFVVRCLGAIVAPPDAATPTSEAAAIEYAVGVLVVRNVVVCGHSHCGAVKAVCTHHVPENLTILQQWIAAASVAAGDLGETPNLDDAARAVTVRQLENLKRFPLIAERVVL